MLRAHFAIFVLVITLIAAGTPGWTEDAGQGTRAPVQIGLTPALLHYQHSLNELWKTYLEERLHRPVEFVQRDNYRETLDLLEQKRIEFAWICSYPFVAIADKVDLVVVPQYQGRTVYRSYLIVPDSDTQTHSIADLKGKVFAYADPLSNTGYLAPRFAVKTLGENPDAFFKRTFFTWAHHDSIEAVANRLAQGAAVDSYIWKSLDQLNPDLTRRTRVVTQSTEFGFPPIVAHRSVTKDDFTQLQNIFLNMRSDPAGREILERLNLDGFIIGNPDMYDGVAEMARAFGEL